MKTRDILTCDIKSFGAKTAKLKPKELLQHIERIAVSLGEKDPKALLEAVIDSVFSGKLPEGSGDEMGRVFDALGSRIAPTSQNMDSFLRLVALCLSWLRKLLAQEVRRKVQDRWHEARGHGRGHDHDHACEDPDCHADHGHDGPEPEITGAVVPLTAGVRSAIG